MLVKIQFAMCVVTKKFNLSFILNEVKTILF
jgi:hypothetical protein